jgi:hypothetical protein
MTAGRYARVGVGHLDDRDRDAELTALPFPQHDPPHWPAAGGLDAGDQLRLPAGCRLPLPGASRADDDAELVGATTASQRQMDQRHVAVSAGRQRLLVELDGVPTGATLCRHGIAMRDGPRRRQSIIRHPGPLLPRPDTDRRVTNTPTCEIIHRAETTW